MDKFKKVEISDRAWVQEILKNCTCPSLEYNFTTLFIWGDIYNTKIREYKGNLLVKSGDKNSFLFPAGSDVKSAVDFILENSVGKVKFFGVCESGVEFLKKHYPSKFEFSENRDMSDYIYTKESLAELKGKKLSSKRNHINRFVENNPDWSFEKINEENIELVKKMHDEWRDTMDMEEKSGLYEEGVAVKKALEYYNELELSGGLIKANGRVIAFSIGDRLNDKCFLVHIEKAFHDIQGAYPMINKQFVINCCSDYELINREEDAGNEGLRKAKLSYNPYIILKKYNAMEK